MSHKWESPVCNICGGDKNLRVLLSNVTTWEHEGQFTYLKCSKCGLVFQSPRPVFEAAVNYYPSYNYWGRDLKDTARTPELIDERRQTYGMIYDWIFRKKTKPGSILDVGSGLGLFLSAFKDRKWQVSGTDISTDVAKFSKRIFDINVKVGDVNKMKFPAKNFDIVSMISVLEHIYDPAHTVKKIKSILKDDGLLVLLVPNINGVGRYIFGKSWIQLQPGRHLYLFSGETIRTLLNNSGYKVLEISHDVGIHNYYSFFQSFRLATSPKFKKRCSGGLVNGKVQDVLKESNRSITKSLGIFIGKSVAHLLAIIAPRIKRSDAIVVYATKA